MHLESIILKNIRSHVYTEIAFNEGTTLFTGDMGGGKSTILMGIEFALFGLGSLKSEQLLRRSETHGYVQLDFIQDEIHYSIKRTLKQKHDSITTDPKNSFLTEDGVDQHLSPTEMKKRILQILNYKEQLSSTQESRIFRYAVFTPQEAMKEVLLDKKDRIDTIRKAFHIEEYSLAMDNAKRFLTIVKMQSKAISAVCAEIPSLEASLNSAKRDKASLVENIVGLKSKLEDLEKSKSIIDDVLVDLEEKQNLYRENQVSMGKLLEVKKAATEKLEKAISDQNYLSGKIKDKEIELNDYKISETQPISLEEIDDKIAAIDKASSEYISSKHRLDGLMLDETMNEETARTLIEEVKKLKIKKEEQENTIRDMRDKISKLDAIREQEVGEIAKMQGLGNNCNMCGQVIDESHKHSIITTKEEKIKDIDNEKSTLVIPTDLIKDIPSTIQAEKYLENMDDIASLKDIVKNYVQQDVSIYRKQREKILSHDQEVKMRDMIKTEITGYKERLNDINIDIIRKEISDSEEQIEKSKQSNLTDHTDAIEVKNYELKEISAKLSDAKTDIETNKVRIEQTDKEIINTTSRLEELREKNAMGVKFGKVDTWIDKTFKDKILEIEKGVLISIRTEFNELFQKWMEELIDDPTKEISIDETFTPVISQDGVTQNVLYLSGGEKTGVALAYRLALNELVRRHESVDSNLLILDEPTDGFSKDQLHKMTSILAKLEAKQIILVSHDRELENCADYKYIVTKSGGESVIMQ